jgi:hypothetical protein
MPMQSEPDAEELGARLRAHLAEIRRQLDQPPLTDENGEVRELTAADFRAMRPAAEVLPPDLVAVLPTRRQAMRARRRNKRLTVSP